MENPKVSVITPTYKRSGMLPRAIKSVLNQSYQNIEIIVVDDNNPDTEWRIATEERMQEFKDDPRVMYVKHEKNMNGSVARNTGIAASTNRETSKVSVRPSRTSCRLLWLETVWR